jgi:uncharacterized protein YsxB (DUF464 family)
MVKKIYKVEKMPEINTNEIIERLSKINELLKKEDFKNAQFLLKDLIFSFNTIVKQLGNWEKQKVGKNG